MTDIQDLRSKINQLLQGYEYYLNDDNFVRAALGKPTSKASLSGFIMWITSKAIDTL
jgi:hypothetical protein